jgi:hypothetical protein
MDKVFIQKIVLTVLAVGIYALSALPLLQAVALLLQPIAGLLVGAAWITKPGDGALVAEAKKARASKYPPPVPAKPGDWLEPLVPIVVLVLSAQAIACAGMDKAVADAQAARDRAQASATAMRSDLSAARGVLDAFSTSVTVLCSFQRVEQCAAAEDTVRVLEAALKTASQAVDVAESAGIAMPVLAQQVATVAEQAKALGATVQALGEAVAYAVDEAKAPMAGRDGLAPLLQRAPESSAQPAPAGAP